MPRISSFHGISIYMYFDDHEPPHFHALYGGRWARFEIESLHTMGQDLPPAAQRRVLEWARRRRDELWANWERARAGIPLDTIDPLP